MTTRTRSSHSISAPPRPLEEAWSRLLRLARTVRQRVAYKRAYRRLATFSDRELEDIGLTRADVKDALSRPLSDGD
ncbi:MAG: DUF1127 domain-containing protein [Pseudomonadota bacterium]